MNPMRIYMFRIAGFLLLAGIQYFFYRKIIKHLGSRTSPKSVLLLFTRLCFGLMNTPLAAYVLWQPNLQPLPPRLLASILYPLSIWHFTFVITFLVWQAGEILRLPVRGAVWCMTKFARSRLWLLAIRERKEYQRYNSHRRTFIRKGMTAFAGTVFTGTTYGALKRDDVDSTDITIPIPNLPAEFNGFTIGLMSDIHSSVFMTKKQMIRYVAAMNEMKTDLVVVAGDFVNSSLEEVYPFAEAFSDLRAPHGVYGVLGNHDYYTRKVELVAREIEQCGIKLLHNSNVPIQMDGRSFHLLGVDDVGTASRAAILIDRAAIGVPAGSPKVLMCHRPYFFEEAARRDIALTLSGHTHGGQVVLGRIGNRSISPARVASQYIAGRYTKGPSHMYVSRGIGTVGIPVRINCPPEITRLRLIPA